MIYKYSDYYMTKRLPQIVITLNSTQKDHRAIWPAKIKYQNRLICKEVGFLGHIDRLPIFHLATTDGSIWLTNAAFTEGLFAETYLKTYRSFKQVKIIEI
jgi:hypothetical protein